MGGWGAAFVDVLREASGMIVIALGFWLYAKWDRKKFLQ